MNEKLRIGNVLSRAFSTWFDHFFGFLVLALVLTLPILPLELMPVFSGAGAEGGLGNILGGLGGILRSVAGYLLTGVVVLTVFQSLKGESGTIMESITSVKSKLLSIIGAAILISIILGLGFLACIIPGIYLALILVAVIPVIVVEDKGIFDAFSRSNELTKGNRLQIFFIYLFYFFIVIFVLAITIGFTTVIFGFGIGEAPAELAAEGDLSAASIILASLFSHLTDALVMPLQATLTTIVYHDLRQQKDQIQTGDMFPDLGGSAGNAPASGAPPRYDMDGDLGSGPDDSDPVW